HHETIDRRFARKKTRLTPMIVVRCVTQQPHSSPTAVERADAGIRKRLVVTDRCGTLRKVFAAIALRDETTSCNSGKWNEPLSVGKPKLPRSRPDLFPVNQKAGRPCRVNVMRGCSE